MVYCSKPVSMENSEYIEGGHVWLWGSGYMDIDLGRAFYFLHQYFNRILHRGLDVSSFLSLALSHVV